MTDYIKAAPKPRTDTTKATRSRRRQALLDVAARRMGFESWSTFEKNVRKVVETASSDFSLSMNLVEILDAAKERAYIDAGPRSAEYNKRPADVLAVLAAHPRKERGTNHAGDPAESE